MSNWKTVRLRDVCVLNYGKSLVATNRKAGAIPVYSSAGITGWHNEPLVKGEGIIVGRKGTVGSVYHSKEPFYCIDTAYYILPDKAYDFRYMYYRLKSLGLEKLNEDSAVPGLNRKTAYSQEFLLPSLEEQGRIAGILGALDDKIECNNRINRNLEEQASVLFRRWFVDTDKKMRNEIDLGSVVQTTSGGTPSRSNNKYYENGTIHWVKSKELNSSFIINTEEKITENAVAQSSAKKLPANSILIAMYGATVGEYGIISKEMTCNQAVCALIPNENYPYTFLLNFVKHNKENLINLAVGSAQQNISQQLIKSLHIIDCTDKIQEFHIINEPLYQQIKINIEENQTLATLRDTLLPKLMNNEIKL